jgi:hypothetical protein
VQQKQTDRAFLLLLSVVFLFQAAPLHAASALDRVLALISQMYPSGIGQTMANIAANQREFTSSVRVLEVGDRVVIGYNSEGATIEAVAQQFGLLVPAEQANSLSNGVAAGLYPIGSALYSLPPAGQLSIFDEGRSGDRLSLAENSILAKIDGSIHTLLEVVPQSTGQGLQSRLAEIASLDVALLQTTVLGAVNTGEIITNIEVIVENMGSGATPAIEFAEIIRGGRGAESFASAGDTKALTTRLWTVGGALNAPTFSLNMTSNSLGITGRVDTILRGTSSKIETISTTVLGAVNVGKTAP